MSTVMLLVLAVAPVQIVIPEPRLAGVEADGATLICAATDEDSAATGLNGNQADNSANTAGAAYVFRRTGTTWAQEAYVKASNTQGNDRFGAAVAISGDGRLLAIGAIGESSNATGVYGDQSNNLASASGAAYLYEAP